MWQQQLLTIGDIMELAKCSKCDTIYPRPSLTKDLVCVMCEPPTTGDLK